MKKAGTISKKVLQGQTTRRAILKNSRALFGKRGYAETSIDDLVRVSHITRGALYHHFRDKHDLFLAVFALTLRECVKAVFEAASSTTGLWERMRLGREAYLDRWTDPLAYRILLVDGPAVLTSSEQKKIQEDLANEFGDLAILRRSIRAVAKSRHSRARQLDALAVILGGAFDAAVLAIVRSADRKRARREMGSALNYLLDALREFSGLETVSSHEGAEFRSTRTP